MSLNLGDINVLIPDAYGATVCDLAALLNAADDYDDLEELTTNVGFDQCYGADGLADLVERVRRLNETGDVDGYWSIEKKLQGD